MSLHCPATLLLVPDDVIGAGAPAQPAADLVTAAAEARIATVYAADAPASAAWAAAVASRVGAAHRALPGLATTDAGTARLAVETIADVHRGEHVLALVPAAWFPDVVARLAADGAAGGAVSAGPTVLECGDDGWFIRAWPDATREP